MSDEEQFVRKLKYSFWRRQPYYVYKCTKLYGTQTMHSAALGDCPYEFKSIELLREHQTRSHNTLDGEL